MNRLALMLRTPVLIVATLAALTGCLPTGDPLTGTAWKLTAWSVSALDPTQFTISASFADGQVSGSSGVNSYGGAYRVGPGEAFSAGPLAATLMGGPEPAMRAESAYLTLLGQAASYQVTDSQLTLFDQNGNESLIFARSAK
jgi:heat shock protein HslJ